MSLAVEKEVKLGTNVRVEAEVLDATFQPTEYDSVKVQLMNPRGEVVFPEPQLFRNKNRPGEYVGNFRATELGWYTLKLPIPGTESYREESVQVVFPGLEDVDTEQAVAKLADLSRQTGGRYLPISEAADGTAQAAPRQTQNRPGRSADPNPLGPRLGVVRLGRGAVRGMVDQKTIEVGLKERGQWAEGMQAVK